MTQPKEQPNPYVRHLGRVGDAFTDYDAGVQLTFHFLGDRGVFEYDLSQKSMDEYGRFGFIQRMMLDWYGRAEDAQKKLGLYIPIYFEAASSEHGTRLDCIIATVGASDGMATESLVREIVRQIKGSVTNPLYSKISKPVDSLVELEAKVAS